MQSSQAKIISLEKIRDKEKDKCIFCNCSENLQYFKKQIICLNCLKGIQRLYSDGYFHITSSK